MKAFQIEMEKILFCGQKRNGETFLAEVLTAFGTSEIKPGSSHLAEK